MHSVYTDGLNSGDGVSNDDGFGNGDWFSSVDGSCGNQHGDDGGVWSGGGDGFSDFEDGDGSGNCEGDGLGDGNGFGEGDGFGGNLDGVESLFMEDESIPNDKFKPLYPGAIITICAAYCAIMTYAITNKLSYSSIENLLPTILFKLQKKSVFVQNVSIFWARENHVMETVDTWSRSHWEGPKDSGL